MKKSATILNKNNNEVIAKLPDYAKFFSGR